MYLDIPFNLLAAIVVTASDKRWGTCLTWRLCEYVMKTSTENLIIRQQQSSNVISQL